MAASVRVDDDVVLVPLRREHAAALAALIEENRERLERWFPWTATSRSVADVERFAAWVEERTIDGEREAYVIVAAGKVAGSIDLHDIECGRTFARIGYWLAARHGGRGVMTAAVRALARHAFASGIARLEIVAAAANGASRAVAERAGFAYAGELADGVPTGAGIEPGVAYASDRRAVTADVVP